MGAYFIRYLRLCGAVFALPGMRTRSSPAGDADAHDGVKQLQDERDAGEHEIKRQHIEQLALPQRQAEHEQHEILRYIERADRKIHGVQAAERGVGFHGHPRAGELFEHYVERQHGEPRQQTGTEHAGDGAEKARFDLLRDPVHVYDIEHVPQPEKTAVAEGGVYVGAGETVIRLLYRAGEKVYRKRAERDEQRFVEQSVEKVQRVYDAVILFPRNAGDRVRLDDRLFDEPEQRVQQRGRKHEKGQQAQTGADAVGQLAGIRGGLFFVFPAHKRAEGHAEICGELFGVVQRRHIEAEFPARHHLPRRAYRVGDFLLRSSLLFAEGYDFVRIIIHAAEALPLGMIVAVVFQRAAAALGAALHGLRRQTVRSQHPAEQFGNAYVFVGVAHGLTGQVGIVEWAERHDRREHADLRHLFALAHDVVVRLQTGYEHARHLSAAEQLHAAAVSRVIVFVRDSALSRTDFGAQARIRDFEVHDDVGHAGVFHRVQSAEVGGRSEFYRYRAGIEPAKQPGQADPVIRHKVGIFICGAGKVERVRMRHFFVQFFQSRGKLLRRDGRAALGEKGAEFAFQSRLIIAAARARPQRYAVGRMVFRERVHHGARPGQAREKLHGRAAALPGDDIAAVRLFQFVRRHFGKTFGHADCDIRAEQLGVHAVRKALFEKVRHIRDKAVPRFFARGAAQAEQSAFDSLYFLYRHILSLKCGNAFQFAISERSSPAASNCSAAEKSPTRPGE